MPGLHRRLARAPLTDLTQVQRLGVLRPDGMGDIVLTTGLLRELRQQLPSTRITFICQTPWAPWMRTCPWVDDVIDVDMTLSGEFREPKRILELLRFVRRVWPLDLEVLVQPGTLYSYVPSRALAFFSGAPVRLCWEDPASAVDTGGTLHTHNLPYPNGSHETEKCFRMLEAMGLDGNGEGRRLDTWWTPEEARRGEEIARAAKKGRRKLVALGLAASEARKRWPRQRYLDVIREVEARRDVAFLALGGPDVMDDCRWLSERAAGVTAGDQLPLGVIWAAIAQCDLYLGNDTGLMHMAAAAQIPVVVVIGVSGEAPPGTRGDATHTGPYGTPARLVRPPAGTSTELDTALVPASAVATATLDLLS